jgi:phage repressor protein C with HTH and peptisase S24 domain
MVKTDTRAFLEKLIADNGDDYAGLSKLIGRNPAYIQQYIKRGSPKNLPEKDRGILARYFGVDERLIGAPDDQGPFSAMRLIPQLAVEASAGAGSIDPSDLLAGKVGFDPKWLKKLTNDPASLSLISVTGDSMLPTLCDGDDIMVDGSAATAPLRDGIHVIRMDDQLMVKRVIRGPGGTLSIFSDNPAWPNWENLNSSNVLIIGRVVWVGRRL